MVLSAGPSGQSPESMFLVPSHYTVKIELLFVLPELSSWLRALLSKVKGARKRAPVLTLATAVGTPGTAIQHLKPESFTDCQGQTQENRKSYSLDSILSDTSLSHTHKQSTKATSSLFHRSCALGSQGKVALTCPLRWFRLFQMFAKQAFLHLSCS